MKRLVFLWLLAGFLAFSTAKAAEPLRVFIRSGKKSHGPGAHEHEQFLRDWTKLLTERGMKVKGGMSFPTEEELAATDVLLMYAQDGGTVPTERRDGLNEFLKRGGGIVVIHTAAVSADPAHWKSIIGGAWVNGTTKWLEGPMSLYYVGAEHPITKGLSNFDLDDEIYYDMDLSRDIQVLAAAYTPKRTGNFRRANGSTADDQRASVYDIQPQMWTYERRIEDGEPYRAFVSIPGHLYTNFARPNYRAVLLRGISWVARRSDIDEFCTPFELASLRYPEGGPTAPEKAAVKLEVHPDFNISLVASEPLINKPINIDWDAQGRMWVAETPEYPNGRKQPNVELWKDSGSLVRTPDAVANRPARDRISILIDTDGDGRADKKEVFYEGLELVTSFVFHKDGVIASAAPDIWLIRDTDGDGKAETVSKLYTGLGTNDTHAVINNLRWGFDGWVYATHGYSSSEHVRSGDGKTDFGRIGSGVVRFRPDGSAFEQYCSKGGNTWGLDISWDDEVFFTQPTSGDLLNHVVLSESILSRGQVPGSRSYKPLIVRRKSYPLMTYEKQAYVQIDLVGSFTASAGCAIYDGGTWPAEWNYSYFTTEPTINLIHHEVVKPDGVSYSANKVREPEFIAGRDMWFRPIETR
ncbi:MAG TPA: PVC-type heme-binding CxxCH protein, partial [Verrucomicrobiae bacterium]|nr:PVC-type heme-binding CxxCH protein [Verrucomicrobiae bacterium]